MLGKKTQEEPLPTQYTRTIDFHIFPKKDTTVKNYFLSLLFRFFPSSSLFHLLPLPLFVSSNSQIVASFHPSLCAPPSQRIVFYEKQLKTTIHPSQDKNTKSWKKQKYKNKIGKKWERHLRTTTKRKKIAWLGKFYTTLTERNEKWCSSE